MAKKKKEVDSEEIIVPKTASEINNYDISAPKPILNNIDIDMALIEGIANKSAKDDDGAYVIPEEDTDDSQEVGETETETPADNSGIEEVEATETEEKEIAEPEETVEPKPLELWEVDDHRWQNLSKLRNEGKAGKSIIDHLKSVEPEIQAKFREANDIKKELTQLVQQMQTREKRDNELREKELAKQQSEEMERLRDEDPSTYENVLLKKQLDSIVGELKSVRMERERERSEAQMSRVRREIGDAVVQLKKDRPYLTDTMANFIEDQALTGIYLKWQEEYNAGMQPSYSPGTMVNDKFNALKGMLSPEVVEKLVEAEPQYSNLKKNIGKKSVEQVFEKPKRSAKTIPMTK